MKKQGIVILIYSIIGALYIALSLLLASAKNAVFWIGLAMVLFAVFSTSFITIASGRKRSSAFPLEISTVVFSFMYFLGVVAVNVLLGFVFKVPVNTFICCHIICLSLYSVITILILAAKNTVIAQNEQTNGKICEMQILIYEFEKIKSKLIDMQSESRKKALPLIDSLLDELRFSDFGLAVDVSDIDNRLHLMANMLSAEVDNLISIKSDDITSIEAIINDTKKVIKDRNMQIKLMNSSI